MAETLIRVKDGIVRVKNHKGKMLKVSLKSTFPEGMSPLAISPPDLSVFENRKFPEFMRTPSDNQRPGTSSSALMAPQFTLQGRVDRQ